MFNWLRRWRAGRIEDSNTRAKTLATLNKEPWVQVLNVEFTDPSHPSVGSMELDWNDQFIDMLKENGYSGRTDEDVVDMWFRDVCRGVIDE